MAILVICGNASCGELIDAPTESAGGEWTCPSCGTKVQVPLQTVRPAKAGASPSPSPQVAAPLPAAPPAAIADDSSLPLEDDITPPVQNPPPRQAPPAKRANPPVASSVKKQAPLTPELLADDSALHSASAPALRPPHQAADRPAKSRKAKEADEPPPTLTDFDSAEIAPAKLVADDGVLEQSKASTIVFAMGVAGMVIGLLAGIFLAGHSIVSAYLGAAIGWASGFIFSLIFVFNADKAEVQMRCSVCRNVFSSEDEACPLCGTVPAATSFNPLAAECQGNRI